MSDKLSRETFAALVGQSFRLHVDDGAPLEATLGEVSPPSSNPDAPGAVDAFSLVFLLADDTYVEQRIYCLEHEKAGKLEIFLVPLGPDREGRMRLEAVFT